MQPSTNDAHWYNPTTTDFDRFNAVGLDKLIAIVDFVRLRLFKNWQWVNRQFGKWFVSTIFGFWLVIFAEQQNAQAVDHLLLIRN